MVVVIKPSFIKHADEKKRPLSILTAQVSPDGARLATGGMDQTVKIWSTAPILDEEQEKNASTKKLLSTLSSHNGNVLCVRWSPDGHYLASGSDDTIVIVWERDEAAVGSKVFGQVEENHEVWKATRRLVGHDSDVGALAWSADGYYLATGSVDTNVLVYETETFSLVKRIDHHKDMVKGLAFDPVGEFLSTQSDDRSICIWRTSDWSLVSQVRDPFVDAPNASWFRRLSWSPDGALLGIPNSVNNGVFVAGIMSRRHLDDGQGITTSLIGHENVVDVVAFNPACFVKDLKKENSPNCFVLAVAARSGISVWMTSSVRPVVVFDTVVERDVLDLSWSSDGTTLYACSSEGAIAVMHFNLSELGNVAPAGTLETMLEASIRRSAQRSSSQPNGRPALAGGTAARPNVLQPRKKGAPNGTGSGAGGLGRGSSEILPIPPPGAPQQITLTQDGKRRIKPAFLGTGGLLAQSSNARNASAFTSSGAANGASTFQPAIKRDNDVDMMDVRAQAGPSSRPYQPQTQYRSSLQDVGMPSWGAPQDQPVQNALQNGRKRKAVDLDNHAFAYERDDMDLYPDNLRPQRPPGRTLGGDRIPTLPAYDGDLVELRPAYVPKTNISVSQEAMELAVPAVKAHMLVKWDQEDTEAETLEYRNYVDPARSSEVAQVNAKGQLQWVDYLPTAIVLATYSPTFSAVSCEDKSLNVYSPSGRRLMPTIILDAPCSFLDAAGAFLLAITARGTLKIWDVRRRKAAFKGVSVYPLISGSMASSSQAKDNPPIINTAKVRMNGSPIVSLSNGTALTYDVELDDWVAVSTTWWSKGSDCWEGRVRSSTSTASKGVVKLLESEANDHLSAQQPYIDGEGGHAPLSIEGDEQAKLGRADDWQMALTLGHLESRMQAAIALDSRDEYRANLVLYARKLAEEAFRGKAEELIKDLMGPIYHRPGRDDVWQPNLLGVPKHTLLREVLSIFSKSKNLSRLGNDMQETLRKMTVEQ